MALALAFAAFGFWRPAWAEGPVQSYAIPAGSLEDALMEFAAQTDLRLIFKTDLVRSARSAGLTGTLTPEQGVARLLDGSGIAYRFVDSKTVTIEPTAPVDPLKALFAEAKTPMDYAGAAEPAPTKPEAPPRKDEQGPTVLPEMTVTASPLDDTSYNVPNATTATKTDTPIMETPVSIQVVPQQVLKDQQAFRLEQALRNVSGVYAAPFGIFSGSGDIFSQRGFFSADTYRNGFRFVAAGTGTGPLETANLDRIEVLKGPASILYGRLEPGGLINLVPKQPLTSPYYSLQQQVGSFDFYRTTLDATGPIAKDPGLFYRFNLAYENAGSFVEFGENERVFIAPTLRWEISPATQATFELQYKHSRDPRLRGIPAIGDRPADLPRGSNNLGDPGSEAKSDDVLFSFDWSHAFNDRWTLRHRFYGDWTDGGENLFGVGFLDSDGRGIRDFVSQEFPTETYATSLDLTGKFDTWGLRHTLLSGMDYFNSRIELDDVVFDFIPSMIDIFNPTHGGEIGSFIARSENNKKEHWYGFYLQDQVELPYHVHLLAGFRYDNATTRNLRDTFPTADAQTPDSSVNTETNDESVNPRFGLLWQPVPALSLYGNYVENFGRANLFSLGASNTQLKPETAQQWEVGLKTELFDGRMTGTLAWYNLTKQNIPSSDPFNPGFSLLTGEARNQGLELDVAGEILPGWQMIGVYSYIDSEITKDREDVFGNPIGNQGHRFNNVPRHGGSLWTTYEIQQGLFKGLKLGAGVVARSEREGDNENSFQLPGYAIGNLLVGYERKVGPSKVTLQLNVENLTDETYFAGSQGFRDITTFFGAPRTFFGLVRVEF